MQHRLVTIARGSLLLPGSRGTPLRASFSSSSSSLTGGDFHQHVRHLSSAGGTPAPVSSASFAIPPVSQFRKCKPGLVVFDKDGTLIDFQLMWSTWTEQLAWRLEMVAKTDLREQLFDKFGYDYLRRRVHSGGALCCTPMRNLRRLAEDVLKESKLRLDNKAAEDLVTSVWQMPDPVATARPLADLNKLFHTLREMDMKIAVCTTDDHKAADETLKALGVRHYVDVLVGGDDPIPSKPNPEQIFHICHKVGVSPQNTIMVGDTATDGRLGLAAGCGLTVGVLDGASSIPDLTQFTDVVIPNIAKIPKIAFQWSQSSLRAEM